MHYHVRVKCLQVISLQASQQWELLEIGVNYLLATLLLKIAMQH